MRDGVGEELKEMKTIRKNYPVAALQINDIISVIQNEFHLVRKRKTTVDRSYTKVFLPVLCTKVPDKPDHE